MIDDIITRVTAGHDLSMQEMSDIMGVVMEGNCTESQITSLLTALHEKGETVQEVAGAAAVMRDHMTRIRTSRTGVVDTCGTGGDGSGTFNVSTAAALVAAAADVPVAKHGNRAITSKTGSADVLVELGVNVDADVQQVEACLEKLGICFCFAPRLHQSMKHVAAARRKLSVPTIFNLLGPLCNPAGARFQLIGVGKPQLRPLLAKALQLLGTERAVVVRGQDGLDEVTLNGPTDVTVVAGDHVSEHTWTAEDFGLPAAGRESLLADGPHDSAEMIRSILNGATGPPRDVVVLNAAAALWTVGRSESPSECAKLAADAIDNGSARELLQQLAQMSGP